MLQRCFAQEGKRPGYFQILGRLPFRPNALEGIPGALSHGTLQETVLRRFFFVGITHLAKRGKAHSLEPSSDRESSVEGQPNERAHLAWALCSSMSTDSRRLCVG
ncbi:unnamed protein product [Sphagnum jensenii]|uniref:Uncharacterized protein n=1 Tax=Sphagnum jensenii TaxID=128206 RepID=A0ABP0VPG9_9BRYO